MTATYLKTSTLTTDLSPAELKLAYERREKIYDSDAVLQQLQMPGKVHHLMLMQILLSLVQQFVKLPVPV